MAEYTSADLERARSAWRAWHDATGQHETMPQMIAGLLAEERERERERGLRHVRFYTEHMELERAIESGEP